MHTENHLDTDEDPGRSEPLEETADFPESQRSISPPLPARIGGYTIKHALATGGMGTVYLAVQEHPRRTVALKVMKAGVTSRSALRRFEYESQILARLRHPNIAQVFDAGTHDDGSGGVPYFVMEYIPNAKSITTFACDAGLDLRERLELFVTVCDAVGHGHQKGVIHRDLKPPNIVVDSSGRPKVIDFGLARATDSDMAVTTLQTDVGELIGTLQYMSPEQCEADPHDLDARSDVYSLGVVLYELVCEQLPYDLGSLAIFEAVRVIRETSPPRPSAVNRLLRGDIETIALKALDKDRTRRYRSAAELGEDIVHYLRDEPILARRPTIAYQMRILVRRNRVIVGVIGFGVVLIVLAAIGGQLALFIALAIGLGGIISGFIRATRAVREASRQRDDAVRARLEAEAGRQRAIEAERAADQQRAEAEKARHEAELEATKNHAINQFLIHDMLACAGPTEARGREITVREVLENASRQIEKAFSDQPEIGASLRNTIGMVYKSLGRYTDALPHLRAALKMRRAMLGDGHPDVASSLDGLGRLLYEIGDFEDAEPMLRESLEIRRVILGSDHRDVAAALSHLGSLLRAMEDWDEAVSMLMEALQINQRVFGEQHPRVAVDLIRLARLWEARKDFVSAERLYRQALEMQRAVLGKDHLHVAVTLNNLANLLQQQRRLREAEPFLSEAVSIFRTRLGDTHQNVLVTMTRYARILMKLGNSPRAEQVYRELVTLVGAAPTDAPWSLPNVRLSYGECMLKQGRTADAEQQFLEAHTIFKRVHRTDRTQGQRVIRRLVEIYAGTGRDERAAEYRALLSVEATAS